MFLFEDRFFDVYEYRESEEKYRCYGYNISFVCLPTKCKKRLKPVNFFDSASANEKISHNGLKAAKC